MKLKLCKQVLAALLSLALLVELIPTTAFAADTDKSIQLGAGSISGWDSATGYDYICYGTQGGSPIKWRVLDDQTNTGGSGLFLLSENLLGETRFDNDKSSEAWQESDAKIWCGNFYHNSFSAAEQAAVLATTKSDDARTTSSIYSTEYFVASENILNRDKVFFLSVEEVENSAYGFTNNNARISSSGGMWWLRSPSAQNDMSESGLGIWKGAGFITPDGYIVANNLNDNQGARPAFNLDTSSVLFISAATGKSASGMNAGLEAVSEYTGNEWKLTLLDSSRSGFTANTESKTSVDENYSAWTVDVNYSGAQTGDNEYVSAAIVDSSDNILYYGRVAQNSASGTASISIPNGLTADSYMLKVFSEQYNGDNRTDYASTFVDIPLTVTVPDVTPPTLEQGTVNREKGTEATVTFTSSEAGSYYYTVVESGASEGTDVNTDENGTACVSGENTISLSGLSGAGEKDIYIVAKDAAGNTSYPLKMTIPGCYTVTVKTDGGGSASAEPSIAVEGEDITLTAEGNHFEEWQVTSGAVTITENKFTMPANDVTVKAVFAAHSYDQQIASDDYLASAATCIQPATYYYSCVCGAKGTETFTSGQTSDHHNWGIWQSNKDGTHTRQCAVCSKEDTEDCTGGTATCTNRAICSVCNAEYGNLNPDNHVWEDHFTVDKEPTYAEEGWQSIHCRYCDATKDIQTVKRLEATTAESPATDSSESDSTPASSTTLAVSAEEKAQNAIKLDRKTNAAMNSRNLKVIWPTIKEADGYDIYVAAYRKNFKGITKSVTGNQSGSVMQTTIKKIAGKKFKKNKTYKIRIRAYRINGDQKEYIADGRTLHVVSDKNPVYTNAKKVQVSKKKYSIKVGKTAKIQASVIKQDRNKRLLPAGHGPQLSYISNDKIIATVSKNGKITAKNKGKCTIYVQALNGLSKKITVRVR